MDEFQGFWGDFIDAWVLILGQHSKEVDGMGEGGWWVERMVEKPSIQTRDLQYISIWQYINIYTNRQFEYCIMIPCSMITKISDSAEQCMFYVLKVE